MKGTVNLRYQGYCANRIEPPPWEFMSFFLVQSHGPNPEWFASTLPSVCAHPVKSSFPHKTWHFNDFLGLIQSTQGQIKTTHESGGKNLTYLYNQQRSVHHRGLESRDQEVEAIQEGIGRSSIVVVVYTFNGYAQVLAAQRKSPISGIPQYLGIGIIRNSTPHQLSHLSIYITG